MMASGGPIESAAITKHEGFKWVRISIALMQHSTQGLKMKTTNTGANQNARSVNQYESTDPAFLYQWVPVSSLMAAPKSENNYISEPQNGLSLGRKATTLREKNKKDLAGDAIAAIRTENHNLGFQSK
jgi:hypothetical protein